MDNPNTCTLQPLRGKPASFSESEGEGGQRDILSLGDALLYIPASVRGVIELAGKTGRWPVWGIGPPQARGSH